MEQVQLENVASVDSTLDDCESMRTRSDSFGKLLDHKIK